jgi:hypothetical protein
MYLFAGSDTVTIHHTLGDALYALGATLITDGNYTPPTEVKLDVKMIKEGGGSTFRLYGTVSDGSSGLSGVTVGVVSGSISVATTSTDTSGKYAMDGLQYDIDYVVSFSLEGYVTQSFNVNIKGGV